MFVPCNLFYNVRSQTGRDWPSSTDFNNSCSFVTNFYQQYVTLVSDPSGFGSSLKYNFDSMLPGIEGHAISWKCFFSALIDTRANLASGRCLDKHHSTFQLSLYLKLSLHYFSILKLLNYSTLMLWSYRRNPTSVYLVTVLQNLYNLTIILSLKWGYFFAQCFLHIYIIYRYRYMQGAICYRPRTFNVPTVVWRHKVPITKMFLMM